MPSVKSTISTANDLKFIVYARVIEILNHKYHLFFSLPAFPLFIWVTILGGFLNQRFLKVKPQEENTAQEGEKGGFYRCLLIYSGLFCCC